MVQGVKDSWSCCSFDDCGAAAACVVMSPGRQWIAQECATVVLTPSLAVLLPTTKPG